MVDQAPIGRLAPTPSAGLHVGNIFASMLAWLIARSAGGKVVLRIEDLDYGRCKREFADKAMADLERLGITWDNREVLYQHDRTAAYERALELLDRRGLIYPCFCSRADLHAASAPHVGERYIYAGTCKNLDNAQRRQKMGQRPPAYRMAVPSGSVEFEDGLQGAFRQDLREECGDFIVKRSDGVFAYQLAVVVDDLYQGVTQVVRGCDLIDSTPQQQLLRRVISGSCDGVEYYHVPLLLDEGGRKLSKRNFDQGLDGLMRFFPSVPHFIGYLAWHTGLVESPEPTTMDGLLERFSLEALKGRRSIRWQLPPR